MTTCESRDSAKARPKLFWLWRMVGGQLQNPVGIFGGVVGWLMGKFNVQPNRFALRALKVEPCDHVLELGSGPGRTLKIIAQQARNGHTYGLDQSETMLRQAGLHNGPAIKSGRLSLIKGDFKAPPFHSARFDKVLAVNVAYFFGVDGREMAEIHRVLKPGGCVVIYVTDQATMEAWPFAQTGGHRLYGPAAIRACLEEAGFGPQYVHVDTVTLSLGVRGILGVAQRSEVEKLRG